MALTGVGRLANSNANLSKKKKVADMFSPKALLAIKGGGKRKGKKK